MTFFEILPVITPYILGTIPFTWFVVKLWVQWYTSKNYVSKDDHNVLSNHFYDHKGSTELKLSEMTGNFKLIDERLKNMQEQAKIQGEQIISKVDHLNANIKQMEGSERKLMMETLIKLVDERVK
jgi:hypothetical protein